MLPTCDPCSNAGHIDLTEQGVLQDVGEVRVPHEPRARRGGGGGGGGHAGLAGDVTEICENGSNSRKNLLNKIFS